MIYRVLPDTKTHEQFLQFIADIKSCNKTIRDFLTKVGAADQYLCSSGSMAGLLGATFDKVPSDWKVKSNRSDIKCYVPKKSSPYFEEFKALPKVPTSRISEILDYDMQEGPPSGRGTGRIVSLCPGFENIKGTFIITTHSWDKWRPKKDMEEITMGQYEQLKSKKTVRL